MVPRATTGTGDGHRQYRRIHRARARPSDHRLAATELWVENRLYRHGGAGLCVVDCLAGVVSAAGRTIASDATSTSPRPPRTRALADPFPPARSMGHHSCAFFWRSDLVALPELARQLPLRRPPFQPRANRRIL